MSFNARHWDTHTPSMDSLWRFETEAQNGSEALRQAMRREFMAFARKHRVSFKDAKLLLMNGVAL